MWSRLDPDSIESVVNPNYRKAKIASMKKFNVSRAECNSRLLFELESPLQKVSEEINGTLFAKNFRTFFNAIFLISDYAKSGIGYRCTTLVNSKFNICMQVLYSVPE